MKKFRLIRSAPGSAIFNMELDAQIFQRYLKDGIPVLRLYRWQSPSFTYGISQRPEGLIDISSCAEDGVQIAKRVTGGGVLFHDDEITYSFACSRDDVGERSGAFVSYREICAFLIRFYGSLGLEASYAVGARDFSSRSGRHGFCSASREKYDIIINGRKIGGNAQKRCRQAILQHGSIPLTLDWGIVRRYAKILPADIGSSVTCLSQELPAAPDKDILEEKLIDAFRGTFGVEFIAEENSAYETSVAE